MYNTELTEKCRNELIDALCFYLDTRDKRFMFFYIFYSDYISNIDLEGSPKKSAFNIYSYFKSQGTLMTKHLILTLNDNLRLKIIFETKEPIL